MVDETNIFPLIRTKLHQPQVVENLVLRPRLLERLHSRRQRPLTLVVAPAGYGKTTLVCSWLKTFDWPSAWVSLDEEDSDLVVFLTYFIAAIQTMFPQVGKETLSLLKAANLPPSSVLTRSLLNELAQIETAYILGLDDYHVIRNPLIHDLLTELLRYPPPSLHLVLTSRTDPPFNLAKLRARSQVTEIRTHDLRFTQSETATFLQQELETPVDAPMITTLTDKFEGWIAGLRLVTLSLRHRGEVDLSTVIRQGGNVTYVTDYLVAEVLADQAPAIQNYLLKTAILDRFCAPLCEAVCGYTEPDSCELSGEAFLQWLQELNLFVFSLDDRQTWYRYHHFFRQILQQQLEQTFTPADIAALHVEAGNWLAENGLVEEALHHLLAADNIDKAVELAAGYRHKLIDQEQWSRLERQLHFFSPETINNTPQLKIIEAWLNNVHGQWEAELTALAVTENLLAQKETDAEIADPIRGEICLMRANLLGWSFKGAETIVQTECALKLLPRQWRYAYTSAYMIKGFGYVLTGQVALAEEHLHRGLTEPDIIQEPHHKSLLLFGLTGLHWLNLNLEDMHLVARQYLAHGQQFNLPETLAVAQFYLGCIHYHQNNLREAEQYFMAVAGTRYTVAINFQIQGVCGLALTYLALGQFEQADDLLKENQAVLMESQNFRLVELIKACRMEVALAQGQMAEATRWAESYNPRPPVGLQLFYIPQLSWVKVLLAQGTATSQEQAATLLAELLEIAGNAHLKSALLNILPLQALLDDMQGNTTAALMKLEQALKLAESGGFIRLFVDLGPQMANLLARLHRQGIAPDYIGKILAAFPTSPPTEPSSPQADLAEPLSERELEILGLLAQRFSNKEIAAELVITPGTVRQHTHNIYQKLAVNGRRQAVDKATELGILSPTG